MRLGHKVQIVDPCAFLPTGRLADSWVHHTGALGLAGSIRSQVLAAIRSAEFDLVWVDAGNLVSAELIAELRRRAGVVINYNVDDPFGLRDGNKWRLYLQAVPFYDLVVVVRDCNVSEAYSAGAKSVLRVHMSSDEVAHAPRTVSASDRMKWASDVAFVGTWMPERGPFMAGLIERGVPLSIWGDRWPKAKEWSLLKRCWRGPGLEDEDDYAMALQCAKVCIGMLSKGNRDLCTTRSFEIPSLGGVLCAERTPEHLALYDEDVEAVFWRDADECADKCEQFLTDEQWRIRVARNGQLRSIRNGTSNEGVTQQVISRAFDLVRVETPVLA